VYGSNGIVGSHSKAFVNTQCIVIGRKGSAGALNLCLADGCCVTDVAYYCIPPQQIDLTFCFRLLHTLKLDSLGKGIKPGLNRNEAYVLVIAVPPRKEQLRIVAKIDELMACCDELEKLRTAQKEARLTVHAAAIKQLLNIAEPDQHEHAQAFLAEHFGELYTVKENVAELRKAILQLAVMGKLVPQNPDDQPASELLRKINAVKRTLEEKEGLRTSAAPFVSQSEELYGKPEGWSYCRLGNIGKFIDYRGKTPTKVETGVPLITAKNVRFGYINREPKEYVTPEEYIRWMTRGFPRVGDILFTTEAPLGNVAIIDIEERFALAQRVICLQLHMPGIASWLKNFMMSDSFQERLLLEATGMTATGIKASKLKEMPVPIPPLEEQYRIVAKVDQVMALCDSLDQQIDAAATKQAELLGAVIAQV
jgi:type I restriction enzyme S subunit